MTAFIEALWQEVYGTGQEAKLTALKTLLDEKRKLFASYPIIRKPDWYRDAVIYALYVDAFATDFHGLTERLDYLARLGVNTLWLLPILDSPMRDQGFDIRDFRTVREDLGGNEAFQEFILSAHARGIHILFDMAVNHTSDQHPWFVSARADEASPYRDYYIWSQTTDRYQDARLIFKGMVNSNWSCNEATGDYYFHRFYAFQPDLNYRNPDVLLAMIENFLYWKQQGVDGLRMDAIPFIWKEEGTSCEDLPNTHRILKLIRASLDYCQPGTLLIAEANMPPRDVVRYFGNDDECQAAYHFPLMPQFYMALAESDRGYIEAALSPAVTPPIPEKSCWMAFLRCHDELTLEYVSNDVRQRMNQYYLHDADSSFREGEGIAGRLFNLLQGDVDKILLMHAMLFATEGSPILYYGDEVGMENNLEFYRQASERTGNRDARFLNRGDMDWKKVERALNQEDSIEHRLFAGIQSLAAARKRYRTCFLDSAYFLPSNDPALYGLERHGSLQRMQLYHNLGDGERKVSLQGDWQDVVTGKTRRGRLTLPPWGWCWLVAYDG